MSSLESWAAIYLFNSIWQVPLVFAAAWIAAHLVRSAGPRSEHRVWVGALMLEAILPVCNFHLESPWRQLWEVMTSHFGRGAIGGGTHVIVGPGTVSGGGLLRLSPGLLAGILAIYICGLMYFIGRLAWGLWMARQMRRCAEPLPQRSLPFSSGEGKLERHRDLSTSVEIAISSMVSGPVTVGIRRRVLLLPPGFLDHVSEVDLAATLAHELAHIRRWDFAKNLFYGFFSLLVAYHPLLWFTCSRLVESREMVCDEIAAETAGNENYAHSLLRLASMLIGPVPVKTLHAIGIFDANIFERRIMNLTHKRTEIARSRRLAIASACAVIALATCTSAVALRIEVSTTAAQNDHPKSIHVKNDAMKIISKVQPIYPPDAKAAGIQGSVVLDATISKEGVPEHLVVQNGPQELQKSALDAVRQWRWQPYLLNGDPIEVETTVTVVYELAK